MRSVLTILAGACCASLALAQPATGPNPFIHHDRQLPPDYHGGRDGVFARDGIVGKVVDVVFNDGGCIDYVLVQDAEGFIPVPWSVVTVNYDQKVVTVQSSTVTVEKLREVRFTEARMPNFSDPAFTQRMTTVWGASASRSGSGRTGSGSGTGSGTTTPDRKSGTTTPPAKDSGTTTPDRKSGTTPPDRTDPKSTTPPTEARHHDPAGQGRPEDPAEEGKDKDKDGK